MAKRGSLDSSGFAKSGGFGLQEGRIRVEDNRFITVQHTSGAGVLSTPFMAHQLDICKVNVNGDAESEVETKDLVVCWGPKDSPPPFKFKFRPAVTASATSEDRKSVV